MKKVAILFLLFILFFIFFINSSTYAENEINGISRDNYLKNFYRLPVNLVQEVFRTDKNSLNRNLLFTTAFLGSLYQDQKIRNFTQQRIYMGDTMLSRFLYNIGNKNITLYCFAGTYFWSKLTEDIYLEDTLLIAFQSLLVTQIFTELFKINVKRIRPIRSPDGPFKREKGNKSFFSGHSSGCWSVLTIIAARYPETRLFSYCLAAAVAVSRIYEDAHWASDVLVGSLVGYGISRLTLKLNKSEDRYLPFEPLIREKSIGGYILVKF